jgi:hypothetical protein
VGQANTRARRVKAAEDRFAKVRDRSFPAAWLAIPA